MPTSYVHNMNMPSTYRRRRIAIFIVILIGVIGAIVTSGALPVSQPAMPSDGSQASSNEPFASAILETLPIKGRATKTDYSRDQFGGGWSSLQGCDTRNIILHRDLTDVQVDESCNVTSGILNDPYTGKIINFTRGSGTSGDVQIDHVVALSNAWQTGALLLSPEIRVLLANDPLELLAVDGPSNQQKSDGDAATWLPPNKPFRCQYVARQIAVKQKYGLWVTQAEHDVMSNILDSCPNQRLPTK